MAQKIRKFDALFADPQQFLADRHLMVKAIAFGWLSRVDQADREALMVRFCEAIRERETSGHLMESQESRALIPGLLDLLDITGEARSLCVDLSKPCTGHHYEI